MKRIAQTIKKTFRKKNSQEQLIEFVSNKKNIDKAVKGSMDKRIELMDRVDLKEKHA